MGILSTEWRPGRLATEMAGSMDAADRPEDLATVSSAG